MDVKKFKEFTDNDRFVDDYGCVLLVLEVDNWVEILSNIKDKDVYEVEGENYGKQKDPHVTVLYGLHADVKDDKVIDIIDRFKDKKFIIESDGIDTFENEDFDVVKFSIKSNKTLEDFNKELSKLPNTNDFPDYIPHITISYVNKGKSKKYINKEYKIKFKVKSIEYSKVGGENLFFELI